MSTIHQQQGSAAVNGELWGERARDWAELHEGEGRPDFDECMRRTRIGAGTEVLDLGCGAGRFCRLAASTGASVTGIDAADGMAEIARERVPDGRFDVGDIQFLPYDDRSFDVVTAFHSLRSRPTPSRRSGKRRASPSQRGRCSWSSLGAKSTTSSPPCWAPSVRCYRRDAPAPQVRQRSPALGRSTISSLPSGSGSLWTSCREGLRIPRLDTALRAIRSAGMTRCAERTAGEAAVTDAIARGLAPYRTSGGGYRLEVQSRYIHATCE